MNRVRKKLASVCLAVMGVVAAAMVMPAFAEEGKPAAGLNADDLKKALGLSIYLQGGYTVNMSNPDSGENDFRIFDHKANSFTLDLAEIVFQKDAAPGNAGFKAKFSAGETAKWIHSRGLSGAALDQPQAGEGTTSFDLTEAYVSYNAPIGKGLRFDFGKMVTYHGAEVIEAIDNPNYSRSLLFNYAIPFTHTGLKISYAFTDVLSASFHIVNGWDNSTDNNNGKTYGASVTIAPAEAFSLVVNGMTGPEQDSNNSNKRDLVDIVATIKPARKLSLILNGDYGREQNAVAANTQSAEWSGISGIVKYDFNETYSVSVRGESFRDPEKFRTGMASHIKEVTFTPEFRLNGGLILRPEYRHDWSDEAAFDGNTRKKQDTLALGVMYRW